MIASEYGYTIDEFLDLTMRQLHNFLHNARIRNTTKEYHRSALLAKLHNAEIASLDEVLGINLNQSAFDKEAEEKMDRLAMKLYEDRKKKASVG